MSYLEREDNGNLKENLENEFNIPLRNNRSVGNTADQSLVLGVVLSLCRASILHMFEGIVRKVRVHVANDSSFANSRNNGFSFFALPRSFYIVECNKRRLNNDNLLVFVLPMELIRNESSVNPTGLKSLLDMKFDELDILVLQRKNDL
jgi:hypothetical protein